MPLSDNHIIQIQQHQVEFRQLSSAGVRVVRVFLQGATPRIMFYVESLGMQDPISPTSLFLDEIQDYVSTATELVSQKGVHLP